MASIDRYFSSLIVDEQSMPLVVDWGRAEDLDDSVRIFDASTDRRSETSNRSEFAASNDAPAPAIIKAEKDEPSASVQQEIVRAISIRQPFVEAILDGKKKIEYRSRKTNIRERVYLYASLTPADEEWFAEFGYRKEDCPTGVIVGTIEIVDCTTNGWEYEIHLANPVRFSKFLKPKNQPQPMFWRPQF